MELYVKTGYMLEQAFHTLTNIDFFIQGIHVHTLKAAIYEETFLWVGVLGGPFVHVGPYRTGITSWKPDDQEER